MFISFFIRRKKRKPGFHTHCYNQSISKTVSGIFFLITFITSPIFTEPLNGIPSIPTSRNNSFAPVSFFAVLQSAKTSEAFITEVKQPSNISVHLCRAESFNLDFPESTSVNISVSKNISNLLFNYLKCQM